MAALPAVGLLLLLLPVVAPAPDSARPSFVIVLADDLGYGDLPSYGNRVIQTPNLDRLARDGLRLTRFYSASPVCSPSRAALLTGRIPQRERIYDWIPNEAPIFLERSAPSIATLLRSAGYATALVGKWHLNGTLDGSQPTPSDHGFDYWFATGGYPMPSQRNPENFYRESGRVGRLEGYSSTIIADDAIAWLRRRERSRPFFLFVSFHAPHEELASGERFVRMYASDPDPRRALYYANVTEMDFELGRLLAALDAGGLRESTWLLFASDNGPETLDRKPYTARSFGSAGSLRGMKLDLYEGGIRVPALIRGPGVGGAGSVSDTVVSALDVLPTVCELAGASPPPGRVIDGVSLVAFLRGGSLTRPSPLFWQYDNAHSAEPNALPVPKLALLAGRFKLLARAGFTSPELYDLEADPGEARDLAGGQAARVRQMLETMRRFHGEVNDLQ